MRRLGGFAAPGVRAGWVGSVGPGRIGAVTGRDERDEQHEAEGAEAPQLELPGLVAARGTAKAAKKQAAAKAKGFKPVDPAETLPVARVLVDVPLAHLDRPFDYL